MPSARSSVPGGWAFPRLREGPGPARVGRCHCVEFCLLFLTLTACLAEPPPATTIPPPIHLSEVGLAWGVDRPLADPFADRADAWGLGGHIVAEDLDGDGDVDLHFGRMAESADLYKNDGEGQFERVGGAAPNTGPGAVFPAIFTLAADFDGDGLPDLLSGGDAALAIAWNEGDFQWSQPERVWAEPTGRRAAFVSVSAGDLDGDGDLDVVLPTLGPYPDPPGARGAAAGTPAPDRILLWDGSAFVEGGELRVTEEGSVALAALPFDQDGDGRLEVLVPADLGLPTAIWHRDEGGTWSDRAPELGAALRMGAMGVDAADLDGDGGLDLCMSDTGPPRCLLSQGGAYVEAGPHFGLASARPVGDFGTVGWGLTFADLDLDGWDELIQASGPFAYGPETPTDLEYPSVLWRRDRDGAFADISVAAGLDLVGNFPGVVAADLDGDRCLELVFAGPGERPRIYTPDCSWGAATLILDPGPPGTTHSVEVGGRTVTRQVSSLRGTSQGPSTLHFALGESQAGP